MGGIAVMIAFVFLAIGIRFYMDTVDRERIEEHVRERGGRVLETKWTPFGTGWFGDKNRIYAVEYEDEKGDVHIADCKTSMFSGVYWNEDDVVDTSEYARCDPEIDRLASENERLRAEVERLRRGR